MHFAFLQILLGALVAGIDAGRTYNDWPMMAGEFFPSDAFDLEPQWRNFFENPGLVQWLHRMAGYLLIAYGVVVWLKSRRSGSDATRAAFSVVLAMLVLQMCIGIGAGVLFVLILRARFLAQYPLSQSVRGTS